ncbi:HNH endonuclease [Agromyces sp. NPDC056379]|uniref:HNH endonuclease n=1 Tax=unclassified Agromyces TaxID=2639701 RepID=UPI0035D58163
MISDRPSGLGTEELIVRLDTFTLPLEKGAGHWVQTAYDDAAAGGRLVFSPLIGGKQVEGAEGAVDIDGRVAAFKEGRESYAKIWLAKYGFKNAAAVSAAFLASADATVQESLKDPAVKDTVTGLGKGFKSAGCDVDHIVEKQIGGTSIPSNLQLLASTTNQASGGATYQALLKIVNDIRAPEMRTKEAKRIQIRIAKATVPPGKPDASFVIEDHLYSRRVTGDADLLAKTQGKPVRLVAGRVFETANLTDSGETPLDMMVRRLVPGMKLTAYRRGKGGAKNAADTVLAQLDSPPLRAGGKNPFTDLHATLTPREGSPDPTVGPAAASGAPVAAQPTSEAPSDPTSQVAPETRFLSLADRKNEKLTFFYPYMSPGEFTSLSLDNTGALAATGVIHPSIPWLDRLDVSYRDAQLLLNAPIDAKKLKSPFPSAFRFTDGALNLQLTPEFVPSGTVSFSVGPANSPVILGILRVALEGGALVATGELTPGRAIPGVTSAKGEVRWSSRTGWSGVMHVTSSSFGQSDVKLGFRMEGERFKPFGEGGFVTRIRSSELRMEADWDGDAVSYAGRVTIPKPIPKVDEVNLRGRYGRKGLDLEGDAAIAWHRVDSKMRIRYTRKPDETEGRFSGSATFQVQTMRAAGQVTLRYDEDGRITGTGTVAYQITPTIRPTLGVELESTGKVRMFGGVTLGDIPLTKMWPSPEGGRFSILKASAKFPVPTPVPGVTVFGELRGSLGFAYGVGPIMLSAAVFTGELYPLEDDPQVKAKITGVFVVPAYAELYGQFGAFIGAELAGGLAGVKGGVDVTPKVRLDGKGAIAVDAEYGAGGFSFAADAFVEGQLTASAEVALDAQIYAAYGIFEKTWTWNVASANAELGPKVRLTIGRVAYTKSGGMTWPSLSQIRLEPELDPLGAIRGILGRDDVQRSTKDG